MSDPAEGDQRELEAIQRQLADTRQHIDELEALIGELPEIYERKFEQQLQPLLEQERLLHQQNLLLRDQLQRALPAAASRRLLAPAPGPAAPDQPPAQPQPAAPPTAALAEAEAEAPLSAPAAPPPAPEPPNPGAPGQATAASAVAPAPKRQPLPYRLALVGAAVAALGAFGLVQRQLAPGRTPASPAPLGVPQAANQATNQTAAQGPRQAPAATGPIQAAAPGSASQPARLAGAQELLVITSGPSWIELRDSQWRAVHRAVLTGPKRFKLGAGLSLKAGRPELVQVQLGGGPAQALPPGEWWTWHRFQPPGA
jgi:hypothetical protein